MSDSDKPLAGLEEWEDFLKNATLNRKQPPAHSRPQIPKKAATISQLRS